MFVAFSYISGYYGSHITTVLICVTMDGSVKCCITGDTIRVDCPCLYSLWITEDPYKSCYLLGQRKQEKVNCRKHL